MYRPAASLLLVISLLASAANAQQTGKVLPERAPLIPARSSDVGGCQLGVASGDLDISGVRARLFNTGGLFWKGGDPVYEVPRFGGVNAIFAAGIWIGGMVDGTLHFAGADYSDWEFWPGPLDEDGNPPADCSVYDRIWVVSVLDVEAYEMTGVATPDLEEWPIDLGAPWIDANGDEMYNLEDGDRPEIYGNQIAFWVMNDLGNFHDWSGAQPIGLEVRVSAFSIASENPTLAGATIYRYELIYKGDATLENARFGFWADADLGGSNDDYVGSDPARDLGFVYNGDADDEGGYGNPPPAVGVDFLGGADVVMYYNNDASPTGNPSDGQDAFNYLQALWRDGTPLTEGGNGYQTGGPVTTYAFPGDPEQMEFWSEVNIDGVGTSNAPGDRRFIVSTESFQMEPGSSLVIDVAIPFAQGDDYLNSVTALKAASDFVQGLYDANQLFVSFPIPPEVEPAAPSLIAPPDGAEFIDEDPTFEWSKVTDADFYVLEIAESSDFSDAQEYFSSDTDLTPFISIPTEETVELFWRVSAGNTTGIGPPSASRSFTLFRTHVPAPYYDDGRSILEIAHPEGDPCGPEASSTDGCQQYGGNTVWRSDNSTEDYYVAAGGGAGDLNRILRYFEATEQDDFEMRFTEDCATPGACLGVYPEDFGQGDMIVSLPFELWNVGDTADPADDIRMIPFHVANDPGNPVVDWANTFTGLDVDETTPITEWIYWMMPDRLDGYELFEATANGFGGPGATYDPASDGDELIQLDPLTGEECSNQNYYVDFCFRNQDFIFNPGPSNFIYPIGRVVLADLAMDGTTPPAGVTIRFVTPGVPVAIEQGPEEAPQTLQLLPAYPNPFRSEVTVPFIVERAGTVRLAVYDILGRQVSVLIDGEVAAGTHTALIDGQGLAAGVYLVVFESEGERRSQKILLMR